MKVIEDIAFMIYLDRKRSKKKIQWNSLVLEAISQVDTVAPHLMDVRYIVKTNKLTKVIYYFFNKFTMNIHKKFLFGTPEETEKMKVIEDIAFMIYLDRKRSKKRIQWNSLVLEAISQVDTVAPHLINARYIVKTNKLKKVIYSRYKNDCKQKNPEENPS
jgi:xylose isomerase